MQLDQILSAAVAAVNDVQLLPSPDVPQYSPTPPAAASQDAHKSHYVSNDVKYELPELETSTSVAGSLDHKPVNQTSENMHECSFSESKNAYSVYSAALHETQVDDGLEDISFFTMDDDNLVITSQQALEMFEPKPEDLTKHSMASYQVINNGESRPEINTPPMSLSESLPGQREMPVIGDNHEDCDLAYPQELPDQDLCSKSDETIGAGVPLSGELLSNYPVYLDGEIPITNGIQVTEVTEDVPVISSEVEVLTTLEAPQYTSLAPVTSQSGNPLASVTDEVLQSLPGSTLDATVDANGRFVVQVVAPGMNMTVQNEYIGREEEVVAEDPYLRQVAQSSINPSISNPPSSTGPYTTYDEYQNAFAISGNVSVNDLEDNINHTHKNRTFGNNPRTSRQALEDEEQTTESHTNVLAALRNSIYRSRAKKRKNEEINKPSKPPSKRRPADILKDLRLDLEDPDSRHISKERYLYESKRPQRRPMSPEHLREYEYPYYQRNPVRSGEHTGAKSHWHESPNNNMMILRPEELKAALQRKGRPGSSSPLVVMRPEDLHAEGGDGNSDPLQVQLVYLVYPMDGQDNSGDQNLPEGIKTDITRSQAKRSSSDMLSYEHSACPRGMPNVGFQPPTAAKKHLSWLQDDDNELSSTFSSRETHDERGDIISYSEKPVASWSYTDVVYFMLDALKALKIRGQDLIIPRLKDVTGKDLINMQIEDFRKFVWRSQTADMLFRYFNDVLQEERRQTAAAVSAQHESPINRLSVDASYDYNNPYNQPYIHIQPPQQHFSTNMLKDISSGGIDTPAPYEVRYETVDTRAISDYDEKTRRLLEAKPSASGKSFDLLHAPSPAMNFDLDENLSDPDQSSNEEEVKPEPPKKRGPGRPRKPENELKKKKKKTGRLWEFIRNLLLDPETCPSLVKWENPEEGVFRFVQAEKVAQRWGDRKQNKDMNYEKLSRAMRYYYKGGVFEAVLGRRLVYKFGKNAKNWRPANPNFANSVPYSQSSSR
ncbi:hypothetical protein SK128_002947 [Halocaridina rubra]|uniref:ETS domain-containing protein n=1 Tax=Halocaridina rubra TaxID=373956 RepID=A0AAN8ZXP6_HALRR